MALNSAQMPVKWELCNYNREVKKEKDTKRKKINRLIFISSPYEPLPPFPLVFTLLTCTYNFPSVKHGEMHRMPPNT